MTTALDFWSRVLRDRAGFLDRVLRMLNRHRVRYCMVGDVALNAYTDPVYTRFIELAIAAEDLDRALALLGEFFDVERDAAVARISLEGSDMVLVIERDPRYSEFILRAAQTEVLGRYLHVAGAEDVLRSRLWRWHEPGHSPRERAKLLYDVARLVEAFPHFDSLLPDPVRDRLWH